jgi:hypothetical protein
VKKSVLAEFIQGLQDSNPHMAYGVAWAKVQHQRSIAEHFGVCIKSISREILADKSIVKKVARIEGETVTLLRVGEAPPAVSADYAKNVMRKIWREERAKLDIPDDPFADVSPAGTQHLWGFAKDVRLNIGDKLGLSVAESTQLAIQAFKHAVFDWTGVAGTVKTVANMLPGYKPRYWKYINLPTIARFSEVVVYAYVMHLQATKKVPKALASLDNNMLAKLLDHIDGLIAEVVHP